MRLSMADLIGHPWMMGEIATAEEVRAELKKRQDANSLSTRKIEEQEAE